MTDISRARVRLPRISSRAWEHPADRGALTALRKLKGFDVVVRKLSGVIPERMVRMNYLGSAVRVGDRQYPRIYQLYAEAGVVLDIADLPELYVVADPTLNAMCIGMDKPIIVLNSALVDLMDDDELRFVLGHELGHAVSGHALYRTLLLLIMGMTRSFGSIPFSGIAFRVITAGLMEWQRKSELSADRAGLLATQDKGAAIRSMLKLASGGHLEQLDTATFLEQAREYAATEDLRDSVLKWVMLETASHPFAVIRAGELQKWATSGEYIKIIGGEYPKRDDDDNATISEEAQAAAESYSEAFAKSEDAVTKLLRDVGDTVGNLRDWVIGRKKD
ncbi:M48 family metallopeptidase [Enemella sp. A6]|uniref:M48 family metallopeptidase n=1 Tax=Enemella sp. A6 TaxID=3440152 RepID=UPI003EB837E4